jgi:hypothetical protein
MKLLSIYFIALGIAWALVAIWIHLVMTGITEPISTVSVFLYFSAMLIGPVLLIAGAIAVLTGRHARIGAILTLVGCAILTAYVAYGATGLFHSEPLEPKKPYEVHLVLISVTLLSDIAALWLYRLISSAGPAHAG